MSISIKFILVIWMSVLSCGITYSQIDADDLRKFLDATKHSKAVGSFYLNLNFRTAWTNYENAKNRNDLLVDIRQADILALNKNDYDLDLLENLPAYYNCNNKNDSMAAEILITEVALKFYSDLAYGNVKPQFGYDGLRYVPACMNLPSLLADHIASGSLHSLKNRLQKSVSEITSMEEKLRWLIDVMKNDSFKDVTIVSNKVDHSNKPLLIKLYQLGIIESLKADIPQQVLASRVEEVQVLFNLLSDGVLRKTIIYELNIPLHIRIQQLKLSINYYRWLGCLRQSETIVVVNIPAAYLHVYRHSRAILEMRMVVGKSSSPTPTLTSKINEVILYPFWHVPHSIATRELLPAIKRNPGYIAAHNYQVINRSGKIVDPYSINWSSLSPKNFPFIIRQSTGCDNALGLLKLNFYNPFSVYLHDTPVQSSFALNKRYFSHGCMRMEKPMELGRLLLKNKSVAIDSLSEKGCLKNQSPVVVEAEVKMPVIVWYNPVGLDSKKRMVFYEDVYKKFYK